MGKFRKKPVVIEAVQFDVHEPNLPYGVCVKADAPGIAYAHIHTLEGPLGVSHADWIITGIKGEKYPCKTDIFEATYEAVK